MAHESTLLARAVRAVNEDIECKQYSLIQIIQAEVMLAHYFFCMGRLVEGKYHTSVALAHVLSARLHKIRSETSVAKESDPLADSQEDGIEEGERINAFWTVYALEKEWANVSGSPSPRTAQDEPSFTVDVIDTPWPLDIDAYEVVGKPVSFRPHCIQ